MANNVKERLIEYLHAEGVSKSEFGRTIGVSCSYVSAIRKSIDPDKIQSIASSYPNLNIEWLLYGKGKMLKSEDLTEQLADRLSEIIIDLKNEPLEGTAQSLGLYDAIELGNFTNNLIWPKHPFDFVKFLNEYPEFNLRWVLTGEGEKFNCDEAKCLKAIHERIDHKNHPELFPNEQPSNPSGINERDSYLWKQILSQNEQLREKDAQIKEKDSQINQLLKILESSSK